MPGSKKVRVGVNGYGVIGKRVAAAVAQQKDMALAGVSERRRDVPQPRHQVHPARGREARGHRPLVRGRMQLRHQAIVIPETIDAIRALTRAVEDTSESIAMTNAALGIAPTLVDGSPKATRTEVGRAG